LNPAFFPAASGRTQREPPASGNSRLNPSPLPRLRDRHPLPQGGEGRGLVVSTPGSRRPWLILKTIQRASQSYLCAGTLSKAESYRGKGQKPTEIRAAARFLPGGGFPVVQFVNQRGVVTPVGLDLHEELQEHFGREEFFQFLAGPCPDRFDHRPARSQHNGAL
jgi:hypothetical protein